MIFVGGDEETPRYVAFLMGKKHTGGIGMSRRKYHDIWLKSLNPCLFGRRNTGLGWVPGRVADC